MVNFHAIKKSLAIARFFGLKFLRLGFSVSTKNCYSIRVKELGDNGNIFNPTTDLILKYIKMSGSTMLKFYREGNLYSTIYINSNDLIYIISYLNANGECFYSYKNNDSERIEFEQDMYLPRGLFIGMDLMEASISDIVVSGGDMSSTISWVPYHNYRISCSPDENDY